MTYFEVVYHNVYALNAIIILRLNVVYWCRRYGLDVDNRKTSTVCVLALCPLNLLTDRLHPRLIVRKAGLPHVRIIRVDYGRRCV